MLTGTILFGVIAVVVAISAMGMLLSRNAVYAALFLVLNFATVALLYLILGAPFISLVQVTVYAGSIMVLFLFVIMLLGAEKLPGGEPLGSHRWLAIILGVVFIAELGLFLVYRGGMGSLVNAPTLEFGSPAAVGMALFQKYSLPFEITGLILVVATVGAILLSRSDEFHGRKRTVEKENPTQEQ